METKAPHLLPLRHIAKRLSISLGHAKRLAKADRFGQKIRVGVRAVRYREEDVNNFISKRERFPMFAKPDCLLCALYDPDNLVDIRNQYLGLYECAEPFCQGCGKELTEYTVEKQPYRLEVFRDLY